MDVIHIWIKFITVHMLQLKHARSRCMDVIHIWNLLMLQLKNQEVVAWM